MKSIDLSSRAPDNFKPDYDCAEIDLCMDCFWFNGEQCIRQLLTEEDIQEIKKNKNE